MVLDKYNLGFGLPVTIRDALYDSYGLELHPVFNYQSLEYCDHYEGSENLRNLVNDFISRKCGMEKYKHIIITAGATQAINMCLRVLKDSSNGLVQTNNYYFAYYSDIIKKNGLTHIKLNFNKECPASGIALIDSPSNPFGNIYTGNGSLAKYNIWDAVYHTPTYINGLMTGSLRHDIMIGSASKAFGCPGLRIGWIATNSDELFKELYYEVKYENATISNYSQVMLEQILTSDKLDTFLNKSKSYLNDNRNEMSNIEYLMNANTPINGMFMVGDVDNQALTVFKRANIEFTDLGSGKIRLNMGQRRETVKEAIKAILKADNKR